MSYLTDAQMNMEQATAVFEALEGGVFMAHAFYNNCNADSVEEFADYLQDYNVEAVAIEGYLRYAVEEIGHYYNGTVQFCEDYAEGAEGCSTLFELADYNEAFVANNWHKANDEALVGELKEALGEMRIAAKLL